MLALKAGLRSWINNFNYYCYGACFTRQVCPYLKFQSHHQVAISRLQGLFGGSLLIKETLLLELSAANSIPAFMFHRYSSMQSLRSSTQCSDNNWDTFYPLYPPQLSFSFKKKIQCPYVAGYWMWFSIHGDFFGIRSWKDFILQLSSAPSNTSNQKRVDVPLGDLLVFNVRLSKIRIKTV